MKIDSKHKRNKICNSWIQLSTVFIMGR